MPLADICPSSFTKAVSLSKHQDSQPIYSLQRYEDNDDRHLVRKMHHTESSVVFLSFKTESKLYITVLVLQTDSLAQLCDMPHLKQAILS